MPTIRSLPPLIVLAVLLLWPTPASAHANLVRSVPAAGAMLETTPEALTLEFSELLDPSLSQVQLFDSRNTMVTEARAVDPARPYTLELPLGVLQDGAYTALWRVRSAEDGHITEGSLPFGVGVPAAAPVVLPPVGAPAPAQAPPAPADVIARWLSLAALALAVGPLGFARLIWRPFALPGQADAAMGLALRRMALAGLALVAAAAIAELLAQAADAGGEAGLMAALPALLTGRTGVLLGARVVLAAVIAVLVRRLPPPAAGPAQPWELTLVVAGPMLLTLSLGGHAAVAGTPVLAADWAHTAAMALWFGGLLPLFVALRTARRTGDGPPLGGLLARFSTLALWCVVVLVISGVAAAVIHLDDPRRLLDTAYGRALLVKTGLFLALLGLGALHMLVVRPRIVSGGVWAGRFRSTLAAEVAVALALLLATAALTSSPPAAAAWAQQQRLGQRAEAEAGGVDLVLWVAPAVSGDNLLTLDVGERPGEPAPSDVLLRLQMPGMQMGVLQVELPAAGGGRYQARGNHLTMVGRWELEAIVRRPGRDDVRHTFTVDVRSPESIPELPEMPAHQH